MGTYTCDPSDQEAEVGRWPQVQGQPRLHRRLCLKYQGFLTVTRWACIHGIKNVSWRIIFVKLSFSRVRLCVFALVLVASLWQSLVLLPFLGMGSRS